MGFTLLEVLIALVVVSLVFTSSLLAILEMTKNSQILKDKTIASIIASNMMAQIRLGITKAPKGDILSNKVSMARSEWIYKIKRGASWNAGVDEVVVSIQNSRGEPLYSLTGYINASL